MTNTALLIDGVAKVYPHRTNPVRALKGVSFDILDNEFFTLLGPSGCGKTTLLRIIAGFEDITEGHVLLYGDDISSLAPNQRPVNTVFQQYALFPHLTVFENVAFGLKRLKKGGDEIKKRTSDMLELIRMAEYGDRKPSELSGGQQQRVALARALAPAPKVLLLDEPLSALDLKLRQAMREELKSIQKQTGITFVFVTHDQEEALAMSDRIAVMSNGEVQQIGSPREIYNNPANHFVANFIGEANILDMTAIPTKGQYAKLKFDKIDIGTVELPNQLNAEQVVSVMIRPEHIIISPSSSKAKNAIKGKVKDISYLGTDTQAHIDLRNDIEILVRMQNNAPEADSLAVGDDVNVTLPANAIRYLED